MKFDTDKNLNTRDLYLASYLFAKGYKLTAVRPDESSIFYWFVFEEKEKCEKEEQMFFENKSIVKAKDYAEAIKYLKRKVSQ